VNDVVGINRWFGGYLGASPDRAAGNRQCGTLKDLLCEEHVLVNVFCGWRDGKPLGCRRPSFSFAKGYEEAK
jgi:hypothetical protein